MNQKSNREKVFSNWLCNIEGIGRKSRWKLLETAGDAYSIYNMEENDLFRLLIPGQAEKFLEARRGIEPEQLYSELQKNRISYYPFSDPLFPERLRRIPDPPTGIYVKGALPEETEPSVAIIGARECSEYGRYAAARFAGVLAEAGVSIISGLARGIDGIGQEIAVRHGGKTYAVMGGSVDICYPEENRRLYEKIPSRGGILSEMPPKTMPKPGLFPQRNRIISGLADVILVVEAREKSGTLITVDMALEQGKEVAVIPGRITDRLSTGCNRLIRQGAAMVTDPADVLQMLNERPKENMLKEEQPVHMESMKEEWRKVGQVLDFMPQSVNQICQKMELNGDAAAVPNVMHILMELMAAGKCAQDGGHFYLKG